MTTESTALPPPQRQPLDIFKTNDVDRLYAVGARLWSRRVFDNYLTSQQVAVLGQIFQGPSSDFSKLAFAKFLKGEVYLKFVERKSADGEDVEKTSEDKPSQHDGNNDGGKGDEEESAEVSIPNGIESARNLALRVRYILWDKAIDFYYDEDDVEEYEIFDEEEEAPKQDSPPSVDAAVRKVDEDDDYDDDDESEDEKPDTYKVTSAEQPVSTEEYDDNDNLILEVPIVGPETVQVDNKLLIENFNKVYHSFENDKETLMKRRKLEENDKLLESDATSSSSDLISMNLGAANLSLKHLLRAIDENKDKLQLQDNELRQLIMDVRKNRSKWASDDKIGQEELYEACEKVVMELRGYTEHSTAFLNRVSKREAPNYYQIIKTPMDLNTILKKLKAFQYKSKTEFVDDVMLIWKNCFTYNTEPRHYLRVHAMAMQKKAQQLIPLIPDITVRDRADVEDEATADDTATPAPTGKTTSKKGKKRTRNGDIKAESEFATPIPPSATPSVPPQADTSMAGTTNGGLNGSAVPEQSLTSTPAPPGNSTLVGENTEMDDEENGETNEYLKTEDNDKDDMEFQMWKNLTSKARSDLCMKRADLFKGNNELNDESEAILRDPKKMKNFVTYLRNYSDTKKHIFNVPNKAAEEDPYLIEYDVSGGLPALVYRGMSGEEMEAQESKLVDKVLAEGLKPSEFAPTDGGLNKVTNENIEEMQEIRKICHKIALIRQMHQQQVVHQSQLRPPEIEKIDDTIDIDPISRLENRDRMNKEVIYCVLRKRVSKIAMLGGFESTELSAVDTLTQIAGDYMDNLVRSIKTHLETPSANRPQKEKSVLSLALLQNGITKPDELHTYVAESVIKQGTKLKDLKKKLLNFLKALLRPAMEMNEKSFADNSEQFMSGDFSNEIGDDFFGFKELGLDKEFGMLGNALPLHLLQSKLAESNTVVEGHKVQREDLEKEPLPRLKESDIEKQIGLTHVFLRSCLEKTKAYQVKQFKTKKDGTDHVSSLGDIEIMEDDDYPSKKPKAKLPPNGKITATKRKITPQTFFLPEVDAPEQDFSSSLSALHSSLLDTSTGATSVENLSSASATRFDNGVSVNGM